MRGGQISIEYLLITAFSFLLLAPLLILFQTQSAAIENDLLYAQGEAAASALVEASERVYYAGPPSRETLHVRIPQGAQRLRIYNDSLVFSLARPSTDLYLSSPVPLLEKTIDPVLTGRIEFRIEAENDGVNITQT